MIHQGVIRVLFAGMVFRQQPDTCLLAHRAHDRDSRLQEVLHRAEWYDARGSQHK